MESSLFIAVINVLLMVLLLSYRKKLSLINSFFGIALNSATFSLNVFSSKNLFLFKVLLISSVLLFAKSFIRLSDGFSMLFILSGASLKTNENP